MVLKLSLPVVIMDEVLKWVTRNYIDGKCLEGLFGSRMGSFEADRGFLAKKKRVVIFDPNLPGKKMVFNSIFFPKPFFFQKIKILRSISGNPVLDPVRASQINP